MNVVDPSLFIMKSLGTAGGHGPPGGHHVRSRFLEILNEDPGVFIV
jgi:hypothetical protein